jgi:hypothetical protein
MKTASLSSSPDIKSYSEENIVEYDCICIGTSMIVSLEACYQAGRGRSVLMVDKEKTFGGAWKTMTIGNVTDVENAIHYFLPDKKGIEFLSKYLSFSIEPSREKYRYFKPLGLIYVKVPYSSWAGRFFYKLTSINCEKSLLTCCKNFYNAAVSVFNERGERSYYTSQGCAEMLKKVYSRTLSAGVVIWYQSEVTSIYFDMKQKKVFCEIGDKLVIARSLTLGHGARLPELHSSNGSLALEEKIHPRPAFHLVVNDIAPSRVREVVMNSDPLIKYIHDVTRFSSLGDANPESKKIFVFALHKHVQDHHALAGQLFKRLKEIKIISHNSCMVDSLYSDVILPTLEDEDLYKMRDNFGDLVNILRTENFTKGIGLYAERWNS